MHSLAQKLTKKTVLTMKSLRSRSNYRNTNLSLLLQMPIAQEPLVTSQEVGVLLISQDRVSSSTSALKRVFSILLSIRAILTRMCIRYYNTMITLCQYGLGYGVSNAPGKSEDGPFFVVNPPTDKRRNERSRDYLSHIEVISCPKSNDIKQNLIYD